MCHVDEKKVRADIQGTEAFTLWRHLSNRSILYAPRVVTNFPFSKHILFVVSRMWYAQDRNANPFWMAMMA